MYYKKTNAEFSCVLFYKAFSELQYNTGGNRMVLFQFEGKNDSDQNKNNRFHLFIIYYRNKTINLSEKLVPQVQETLMNSSVGPPVETLQVLLCCHLCVNTIPRREGQSDKGQRSFPNYLASRIYTMKQRQESQDGVL